MSRSRFASALAGLACWLLLFTVRSRAQAPNTNPPQLTFSELVTLSNEADPPDKLQRKLDSVLSTPTIYDRPSANRVKPFRPPGRDGEPLLRAAFWNIERGQNLDLIRLAFTKPEAFEEACAKTPKITKAELKLIREEVDLLRKSDLILLNEVDLGDKRSDYHDVARELAQDLNMNYTFGVEFIELDPLTLGIKKIQLDDKALAEQLQADIQADPKRYRGLHGSAVLSKYPIRSVKILRLPVCHDWYHDEMKPVPGIEKLKRTASEKVFLEEITQERRRGGRMAMMIDLSVPDVPSGIVTVVNAHLENKCKASCRQEQMDFILEHVNNVANPLILAGDMNTTGSDGSILSISYILREKVKDYRFWAQQLINILNPISFFGADTLARYYRNYLDPTVRDIPVIGNNREYGLFEELREFRFNDGGAIDFSGNKQKTLNGRSGTLANSNERAAKGFVYTFSLPRDFKGLVGRFKLDWFFIKPLNPPGSGDVMAPEFARTMQSLNAGPPERISDHAPITVDLPLKPTPATEP